MYWYSRKAGSWSRAVRSVTFLAMKQTVTELTAFGILPSSWSARILFKSFSQRKSQSLLFLQPPVDPEPAPQDADEEKQEAGQEQEDEEPEEEQQAERRSARARKFNKFLLDQHVVYGPKAMIATPQDDMPPPKEAAWEITG